MKVVLEQIYKLDAAYEIIYKFNKFKCKTDIFFN